MRLVLVVGNTRTAAIEGISAAGADPALAAHTPAADAEIVAYGTPVRAPVVPVSPAGCPTPAVVTRAVRELVGVGLLTLDAGLAGETAAPTVEVGVEPGRDIREPTALPDAHERVRSARELGRSLPDDRLAIGESIPGGTTTALGVLRALGEPFGVSSSLAENPTALKRSVVEEGLAASDLDVGDAAGQPWRALEAMGDPVLAAVTGVAAGAAERGTTVTLAGGTQMIAVAALLEHAGLEGAVRLATTPFVADDGTADLRPAAKALDLDLHVADPEFVASDHVAFERFRRGEGKEGVGMGGALWLADRAGVEAEAVRERVVDVYESLLAGEVVREQGVADRGA